MIKIYDGRSEFYQWDLDRKIVISDPTVTEVHFCNKTDDCSLVVEVNDGLANVPNILLQTDWPINVYAYCGDCYTKEHATFKVNRRTRPTDYVYTETEVKRWEDLAQDINEKTEQYEYLANEMEDFLTESDAVLDELHLAENHERRITQLEKHISNDYFYTDESIANTKFIPADACPYAEIDSFGGMTYKCNNLIPFPYMNNSIGTKVMGAGYVYSSNGITITVNADGSFTVNGTAGARTIFEFYYLAVAANGYTLSGIGLDKAVGTAYIMAQLRNKNQTSTNIANKAILEKTKTTLSFNITQEDVEQGVICLLFRAEQGASFDNVTIYPMLNYGSTALPFEPYYEGVKNTKTTAISIYGANLIPFDGGYATKSDTYSGLMFTVNNDGSVYIKGTATANYTFRLASNMPVPVGVPVAISGGENGVAVTIRRYTADGKDSTFIDSTNGVSRTGTLLEGERVTFIGLYIRSGVAVDTTIYPMLNYGTSAAPYAPYKAEPIKTIEIPEEIQSLPGYGEGVSLDEYNKVDLKNGAYTQVYENGEPIEPTTTVLPVKMEGIIEVPAGGRIEFITDTGDAVPSSISYLLKEGSI